MILNIIGLLIIIALDYILFDKQNLERFFSLETMVLLTIPLLSLSVVLNIFAINS